MQRHDKIVHCNLTVNKFLMLNFTDHVLLSAKAIDEYASLRSNEVVDIDRRLEAIVLQMLDKYGIPYFFLSNFLSS